MAFISIFLSLIVLVYLLPKLLGPRKNNGLPPGPTGLPILGHLHLLGNKPHRNLHNLALKYGPIMALRFGFVPVVVLKSPAAAELVLKTHDLVFSNKPRREAAMRILYEQKGLIFAQYGSYWRDMRKLCTLKLLCSSKIAQFQTMRRIELGLLVRSLKSRETVDISARVSTLVTYMNCLMLFGRKYSGFEDKWFNDMIMETMELVGKSNVADYFPYVGVLDLQRLHPRMKRLSKTIDRVLQQIIDDHVDNKHQKNQAVDIVDTLMTIMESGEAGFEFDTRHVKAVLLDLLIAGTDTSSTTIGWEIMRHPAVMKKIQQELESVVGLDQMVEESHLSKLVYLDCVVKESFRLHPVVPLMTHESMEDCVLDGFHIPKKSRILVNTWAIGRDPNVWHNPDRFIPERFINSDIDVMGRHFELIPFGSGRRACPGRQLGLTVVKLVVAHLVHSFDWELPSGMKPSDLDMSEHFGVVTTRASHLIAIPNYRLHIHIM